MLAHSTNSKPGTKPNVVSGTHVPYLQSTTDEPNITDGLVKVPLRVVRSGLEYQLPDGHSD